MKRFALPKSCLLRKPREYQNVYRQGKRIRGPHFSIIYAPNDCGTNRLGISLYGFRSAIKRNRAKRILKEFYRLNRHILTEHLAKSTPDLSFDIIITVRYQLSLNNPDEIATAVKQLLKPKQHP